MEKIHVVDSAGAGVGRNGSASEDLHATGVYHVTCVGADGQVKWEDKIQNLVTTVGKNDLLDKYLTGATYTATWYLGLVDGATTPTYAAGDTAASHAGWSESSAYSNASRPTPSWNAASSGSKSTTATAFNINGTATIAGTFLISNNTKGGTTGVLYSAGSFTGGNKSVANGDTLNVTYTASV
jgi:hypothetical protein